VYTPYRALYSCFPFSSWRTFLLVFAMFWTIRVHFELSSTDAGGHTAEGQWLGTGLHASILIFVQVHYRQTSRVLEAPRAFMTRLLLHFTQLLRAPSNLPLIQR
jgi:hypothetical protein